MIHKSLTFLIVLSCGLSAGCGKSEQDLARVGDRKISKTEFEAYLRYKHAGSDDPKRLERTLDDYLSRSALAQAVEDEKALDNADLAVELDELKKEMLVSRYFEKYLNDKVGEDAVRNYFNTHQGEYEEQKAHVAHILVRTRPDMDEAARKAAQTRAQEAASKARAGGDFGELAKTYSEDHLSSVKGGDLGWIKKGGIDPRFSETAFKLKPNEVSDVFLSQFGYHVVKLMEGPSLVRQPLESVAGDIRYQLRQQAKAAELKRLTDKIKTEKNVAVLKTVQTSRAVAKSTK
jgi:peptidyl-prolyl cis-trans isomerase C